MSAPESGCVLALPTSPPPLRASQISKAYRGRLVLDRVDFDVRYGKVNVLIGANGAGKSTLMKILSGIEVPTSGQLLLHGKAQQFDSPREAEAAGIGIVHQELRLFQDISIADNIFMGREHKRFRFFVAQREQQETARSLLAQFGLALDPRTLVRDLPLGQQQLVEIARALAQQARILFLDEPTSALSAAEVATLFEVIRGLKRRGVSLVYVSHRLDELLRIGDHIAVLRDGVNVAESAMADVGPEWIVEKMLGKATYAARARSERQRLGEVLHIEKLTLARPGGGTLLSEISHTLHAGEVLGLYGLMGAGRTELLETIAGLRRGHRGTLRLSGKALQRDALRRRVQRGVVLVPEDRKRSGLVLNLAVRENMTLSSLGEATRGVWLDPQREAAPVKRMTQALRLRAASAEQPVGELSGGNQQKVVIARALLANPKVLLLDEPTRGVDVAAKAEILGLINDWAARGMAVIVASSEARELLDCADQILVMSKGRVSALIPRAQATEAMLMRAAGGAAVGPDSV